MTPLSQSTLQALTLMAHRNALHELLEPKPRIDEPLSLEEIQRQLRITAEALKAEISQHVDDEIKRFKAAIKDKS